MQTKYMNYYKQLGLNIAFFRKLSGITQLDLAERANISRTHLSNIEAPNMETKVSLEILFIIADVLEIPIKQLFEFRVN